MRFDLFDLQLFVAIAEAGNLTQASNKLHIVPSASSARIKQLEDSFGVRLFHRASTGLSLTPAGQAMLFHARRILLRANRMRDELSEFSRGLQGVVRIFSISIGATVYLPKALSSFLTKHAQVSVEIEEHISDDIIRAVREYRADIGIIGGKFAVDELQIFPYANERLVVLASVDHPICARPDISFEEALDLDFIGLNPHNTLNLFLIRQANQVGKTFRTRALVRGPYEASAMVVGNAGITIVEESVARQCALTMPLRAIPLSDPWALREMQICVRNLGELPPFARDLVAMLRADGTSLTPASAGAAAPSPISNAPSGID
ncbi:LysR substrate-binding domain-containing protein [Phreatobacter stygius]|uniref:LysR family transcriptional regulator n=1 Tax=Phreatobacter stygius TaxID=1940610 RepID=A0A4D7BAR2_9HYPH|nr:LysR substrate-binding domain-containing protein [Phreatobacter stygius]QCI65202.1 LysR family transcriptional regulator [Phreatobacter stygius]